MFSGQISPWVKTGIAIFKHMYMYICSSAAIQMQVCSVFLAAIHNDISHVCLYVCTYQYIYL